MTAPELSEEEIEAAAPLVDEGESHASAPDWVVYHPKADDSDVRFYLALKHYSRGGRVDPSRQRLANDMAGKHAGKCCPLGRRNLALLPRDATPADVQAMLPGDRTCSTDKVDKLISRAEEFGFLERRRRWQQKTTAGTRYYLTPGPGRGSATSQYRLRWTNPATAAEGGRTHAAPPNRASQAAQDDPASAAATGTSQAAQEETPAGGGRTGTAPPNGATQDESEGGRTHAAPPDQDNPGGGRQDAAQGADRMRPKVLKEEELTTTTTAAHSAATPPPLTLVDTDPSADDANGGKSTKGGRPRTVDPLTARAETLLRPWWSDRKAASQDTASPTRPRMPLTSYLAVRAVVRTALDNRGHEPGFDTLVLRGLERVIAQGRPVSGGTLHVAVEQLEREAGTAPAGPPAGTPANVVTEPWRKPPTGNPFANPAQAQ